MRRILRIPLLLALAGGWSVPVIADSNPEQYCETFGYEIRGEYCVFPDGQRCLLQDFGFGICGRDWSHCLREGYRMEPRAGAVSHGDGA